jgi:hypothetical protein
MSFDNMQHVFLCPRCGAQNFVGQIACQNCDQRFQYNCPYCGSIVDPTLVNCPSCRGMLDWPSPQKVKAFPKQTVVRQAPRRARGRTQGQMADGFEEEPKRKKSDPWLTGCLIVVIALVLIAVAYLIYDWVTQKPPITVPYSPASENETSLQTIPGPDCKLRLIADVATFPKVQT